MVEPMNDILTMLQSDEAAPLPAAKLDPVFGIRIGKLGFLVSTSLYCEVLDKAQVNLVPNVHPWVSGIVNLRGNFVPVFDLQVILKDGASEGKKRRLFTIDRGVRAVALWIDTFPEIKDRSHFKPLPVIPELPQVIERNVVKGYEHDGQIWLEIRYEDLFKALGRHTYTAEEMA